MIHVGAAAERNLKNVIILSSNRNKMISFVYFDVGGVAIRDFSATNKWEEMKHDLGVTSKIDKEFDDLYDEYEKAEITTTRDVDSMPEIFTEKFGLKFPENYSMLDDFIKRFDKNTFIEPVIKEIHKYCRIGLLTDMYPRMLNAIKDRKLLPEIEWDVIMDSTVEKMHKPDPNFFKLAEVRAGVKANEILFVDNKIINVETVEKMGWQSYFYDSENYEKSSNDLMDFFRKNT